MTDGGQPGAASGPRFVILLVLLVAVGIYAVGRMRSAPQPLSEEGELATVPETPAVLPPWERPVPADSRDPDVMPEFDVQVELRREGLRNAVYFYITERHGFLADGILLSFWHRRQDPETGEWIQDSQPVGYRCRERLDFGGSLVENTTLTELEISEVGGDVGTSENWQARVTEWLRVKARATDR